jgi:hypothetical protein
MILKCVRCRRRFTYGDRINHICQDCLVQKIGGGIEEYHEIKGFDQRITYRRFQAEQRLNDVAEIIKQVYLKYKHVCNMTLLHTYDCDCEGCVKRLVLREELRNLQTKYQHMARLLPNNRMVHACGVKGCDKTFVNMRSLSKHRRVSHPGVVFVKNVKRSGRWSLLRELGVMSENEQFPLRKRER